MDDPLHSQAPAAHRGGLGAAPEAWERPPHQVAKALPLRPRDTGGAAEGKPPKGVATPAARTVHADEQFWLPTWARAIVDRNGSPEEMVKEALARVSERHNEERLLEAQAVINELGRSPEHTPLLRSILKPETVRQFVLKRS